MDTVTKRHPIRGFLYGIFFGLGLVLIVVGQGIAALGTWPPVIVFVVGLIAATLWSIYGPAKAPKGPPPAGATVVDTEPVEESEPLAPAPSTDDNTDDKHGESGEEPVDSST
jgi:hypothetical protein